jgi:hypothetical protein
MTRRQRPTITPSSRVSAARPHFDTKLYQREKLQRSGFGKLLLELCHRRRADRHPMHGLFMLASPDISRIKFDLRNKTR